MKILKKISGVILLILVLPIWFAGAGAGMEISKGISTLMEFFLLATAFTVFSFLVLVLSAFSVQLLND